MTAPDRSDEIIRQLATLAESVAGLRRDGDRRDEAFEQERQDSHASRRELHTKVNGVVEDIAAVKGDIRVAAEVTAQTRETVKTLSEAVTAAAPTIADVERAKRLGAWILGGGAAAAIGSGLAILAWGEAIKAWLAHWLGIK